MMTNERDEEWKALYLSLGEVLSQFGREDPYGDGDYWLVDDDYGDTAHKVCVSRLAFLTPELIVAVQRALADLPHWRVLLQVDEQVNDAPASSTGVTVFSSSVAAWHAEGAVIMKRLVLSFALVGLGIPVLWMSLYHTTSWFAGWWLRTPLSGETLLLVVWPSAIFLIADPLDSNVVLWVVSAAINAAIYALIEGLLHAVLRRR